MAGEHLAEGVWTKDGEHLSGGHLSGGLFLESYCKRAFGRGLLLGRASGTKSYILVILSKVQLILVILTLENVTNFLPKIA